MMLCPLTVTQIVVEWSCSHSECHTSLQCISTFLHNIFVIFYWFMSNSLCLIGRTALWCIAGHCYVSITWPHASMFIDCFCNNLLAQIIIWLEESHAFNEPGSQAKTKCVQLESSVYKSLWPWPWILELKLLMSLVPGHDTETLFCPRLAKKV